MIRNNKFLSMAEMTEYLKKDEDSEAALINFVKKFTKLKVKNAKEIKKKIERLNLIKINEKNICKIIDFLPETPEELSKIITDAGLDEDETNKILETIKEFK